MVVLSLVQRIDLGVVSANTANVIGDDIDHHIDVSIVSSFDHGLQFFVSSEVWVDFLPVLGSISMVVVVHILDNR